MEKYNISEAKERSRKLKPYKLQAYELWLKDKRVSACDLRNVLKAISLVDIHRSTIQTWLGKWRAGGTS